MAITFGIHAEDGHAVAHTIEINKAAESGNGIIALDITHTHTHTSTTKTTKEQE